MTQQLPLRYVDEIHARLLVRYGSKWIRLWDGVDENAVKADWASVCGGMSPAEIRKALDSLPDDHPPTAPQFRKLGHTQEAHMLALPQPVDPAGLRRIAQELKPLSKISGITLKDLIERQRARREAGTMTPSQRDWLKTVELETGSKAVQPLAGSISIVPSEFLPPGMR